MSPLPDCKLERNQRVIFCPFLVCWTLPGQANCGASWTGSCCGPAWMWGFVGRRPHILTDTAGRAPHSRPGGVARVGVMLTSPEKWYWCLPVRAFPSLCVKRHVTTAFCNSNNDDSNSNTNNKKIIIMKRKCRQVISMALTFTLCSLLCCLCF